MSAKQRNSFRIACRQLKDCCYRRSVLKTEKLHLPGVSYMQDIVATLLTSERSIMNLKFSNQRFDGDDLPLWIECGTKIKHLELENCAITLSSMQEILTRCSNLSYLALRNIQIVENRPFKYPLNRQTLSIFNNSAVSETFINLSENKVIAGCVKTLIIKTEEIVTRRALASLLSIFPNAKDFEFDCQHMSLGQDEEEGAFANVEYHLKPYTCREFAKYMASNLLQLENMKLHIPSKCKCDKFVLETQFFRYVYTLFNTIILYFDIFIGVEYSKKLIFFQ